MKTVLIDCSIPFIQFPVNTYNARLPLGLMYIQAYLKKMGIMDVAIDLLWEKGARTILEQIKKTKPTIVGLSFFTETRIHALDLARQIKDLFPRVVIVAGGIHASAMTKQIIESYDYIDYVIK